MSNFITHWHFFKNTYSKPYIVRMQFAIKIPAFCSLVADNMCRCDYWFSKDGNIRVVYDIVDDGNTSRPQEEIIEKSIVIDLNTPYSALSKMELTVTNGSDKSDCVLRNIVDIPNDTLLKKPD